METITHFLNNIKRLLMPINLHNQCIFILMSFNDAIKREKNKIKNKRRQNKILLNVFNQGLKSLFVCL